MRDRERGFMQVPRRDPGYRPVAERTRDYRAVEQRPTDDELHEQAARCMDCGVPFCHAKGCPVRNLIPEFNDLAYHNQWEDALALLLAGGCFPEFTGRICPAPCEGACVLGINADPVAIRQVELAIIEKAFERGYIQPQPPAVRRPERVAVIGSGPAGLAVAQVLNRRGYPVVVYENGLKPGGILRYGIPDFKLEKWVIDRRLKLMQAEGVTFETGVEIGEDLSYRFLASRFAAVVLTGGARAPRDLRVPGRELAGIHFAMDFLTQQNMRLGGEPVAQAGEILATGKRVVVIGGGDTGADCVGTSWRQGARAVLQFEIMPKPPPERSPKTPWPQWPLMLRESSSHKEGGQRRWAVSTVAFEGEQGQVQRIRCVEVEWQESGGRPAYVDRPGSEFVSEADLVLLAMGFSGPGPQPLADELDLKLDERGFIQRAQGHMTSAPGVFVAGDMALGASLVVRAIRDGQESADEVDAWLTARRPAPAPAAAST